MTDYHDSGSSSGSNTTLIIVGIVGGVVLVFLLVCGGLAFLAIRAAKEGMEAIRPMMEGLEEMAQSQNVANDFLENIRVARLEAAYQSTTESFKKRLSRKAFDELVQQHPELKQQDVFPIPDVPQNASKPQAQPFVAPYRYRFSAPRKDGKEPVEFKITVAKENGILKVDQLTLYKEENPKEEKPKQEP
jgi:hypothetical protein